MNWQRMALRPNKWSSVLLLLSGITFNCQALEVIPLLKQGLPALSADQEVQLLSLEYAPGEESKIHRHSGHTFVYVLEGSLVMGVKGQEPVNLKAGQTFYETPADIHTISRNGSNVEPARFLVFFLKPKNASATMPVETP